MSHVATLPFGLGEHPVAAESVELARLLGQTFMHQHPDLGLVKVRMFKTAAAMTAPKNMVVQWSDDGAYTVVLTTEVTEFACGVLPPDISGDLASGDLVFAIMGGGNRVYLRNEDAATVAAGNLIIPAATSGLINDGGTTLTPRLDFARAIDAFTANAQTKLCELVNDLVG